MCGGVRSKFGPLLAALAAALAACGSVGQSAVSPPPKPQPITLGATSLLTAADIGSLTSTFNDQPFTGGQKAPIFTKWVGDDSFLFLEFDQPASTAAKALAYLGIGLKGAFCAETRPDKADGSFTRFQRYQAPDWAKGAGGQAGDQGYWLSFLAVDRLSVAGRAVPLGIDYAYPAATPPTCGSTAATPTFSPAGAGKLTTDAIGRIFAIFNEQPLQGGQVPPRTFKTLNDKVLAFVQFDKNAARDATTLHYFGIWQKSTYCKSTQPSADFTHFHRLVAPSYALGHAGPPGSDGFWGTWVAAQGFQSQGRDIAPGVDRQFSPTPPPTSC